MNLAIVDDDGDVRNALVRLLRSLGHDVYPFASAEAFERERIDVDCAIVDVRMPGIGGIELCRRLRGGAFPVPVVLISGGSGVELDVATLAEPTPSIAKPFECDALMEAIDDAVSSTPVRRLSDGD